MRVLVNGEGREVASVTLDAVLVELGYADKKVATALDGDFVPVGRRSGTGLSEGCAIEIVAPMQGG